METEVKVYDNALETLFIQFMMSNPDLFVRCKGIIRDSYFDNPQNKNVVSLLLSHSTEYATIPAVEQVKVLTGKEIELIPEVAGKEENWFLKEIESFCRYKALRDAILSSPELLDEGRYGEVETLVKSAVQISLVRDLGTKYYDNPKGRLESLLNARAQISTGWKTVDEKLYGGLNRGELTIFAGQCVTANTKVTAVKVVNINFNELQSCSTEYTECPKLKYLSQFYTKDNLVAYKEHDSIAFECLYNNMQPSEVDILSLANCNDNYYVTSPDGYVLAKKLICKGVQRIYCVEFTDGTYVMGSLYHMFENIYDGWVSIANLSTGQILKSSMGSKTVQRIWDTNEEDLVFDLVIDSNNHRYYTNGVSSHNSGAGKSLFLQNLGVNFAQQGMYVCYITLELSEVLCSMRIDAMHTGFGTKEVIRNIDEVHVKLKAMQKKSNGDLSIKQLPNGCTSNDIRAYLKELEIQEGRKVDVLLVDYLDLMMPMSKKISAENLFVKDKYVTEELRNLAVELDIVTISASQLNRGSHDTESYDASHISGGISKVNTADNVIGIFTQASMKDSGRYQLQFIKTRSSSGVGSRIDLAFDVKTLRITDLEEGDEPSIVMQTKKIQDQLRQKSIVRSGPTTEKESVDQNTGEILPGAAAIFSLAKKR